MHRAHSLRAAATHRAVRVGVAPYRCRSAQRVRAVTLWFCRGCHVAIWQGMAGNTFIGSHGTAWRNALCLDLPAIFRCVSVHYPTSCLLVSVPTFKRLDKGIVWRARHAAMPQVLPVLPPYSMYGLFTSFRKDLVSLSTPLQHTLYVPRVCGFQNMSTVL